MVDNASTGSNTSTNPNTKRRKRRKSNKSSQYNFSAPSAGKLPTQNFTNPAVAGSAAHQSNNSDFVNFLNGISNFAEMTRDDLIEQMYTTEPEIATAVDSFALMVRNSFQFFDIVNYNEIDDIPDTSIGIKMGGSRRFYNPYFCGIKVDCCLIWYHILHGCFGCFDGCRCR